MVGLWLVCRGLRLGEYEREKWVGVPCGWCAMGGVVGCAMGLWWLCVGLWWLG